MNPNQLGRSPFPASASQWMLVGLRGGVTPPPPGLNDGDPVTTWPDSSVNGNNAAQTGSARPIFKTAILNGKPVVRFVSSPLQGFNLASAISSASPWTVLAVMKAASSAVKLVTLASSAASSPAPLLLHNDGHIYVLSQSSYLQVVNSFSGAFHIFRARTADITPSGGVYVDGTFTTGAQAVLGLSGDFNELGWDSTGSNSSDGDIAELIFYNATVSLTDCANIEKYLGTKYAITVAGGSAVQPDTVTGLVGWWKADSLGT
jgi:hypothetical protein